MASYMCKNIMENFMQLFGELPSIVEKIPNGWEWYNTARYKTRGFNKPPSTSSR